MGNNEKGTSLLKDFVVNGVTFLVMTIPGFVIGRMVNSVGAFDLYAGALGGFLTWLVKFPCKDRFPNYVRQQLFFPDKIEQIAKENVEIKELLTHLQWITKIISDPDSKKFRPQETGIFRAHLCKSIEASLNHGYPIYNEPVTTYLSDIRELIAGHQGGVMTLVVRPYWLKWEQQKKGKEKPNVVEEFLKLAKEKEYERWVVINEERLAAIFLTAYIDTVPGNEICAYRKKVTGEWVCQKEGCVNFGREGSSEQKHTQENSPGPKDIPEIEYLKSISSSYWFTLLKSSEESLKDTGPENAAIESKEHIINSRLDIVSITLGNNSPLKSISLICSSLKYPNTIYRISEKNPLSRNLIVKESEKVHVMKIGEYKHHFYETFTDMLHGPRELIPGELKKREKILRDSLIGHAHLVKAKMHEGAVCPRVLIGLDKMLKDLQAQNPKSIEDLYTELCKEYQKNGTPNKSWIPGSHFFGKTATQYIENDTVEGKIDEKSRS